LLLLQLYITANAVLSNSLIFTHRHKNEWNAVLSEFNIPGYDIYSNNLVSNNRGIIVCVSQDLSCKLSNVNVDFSEYLILEIQG